MMEEAPKSRGRVEYIDGLRGLAVLAVLLFHIDKRLLPGGFVGVDVFFVLSGFLISRVIARDEPSNFSYLHFISNRIKRLAPASVCMLAVVSVVFLALFRGSEDVASFRDAVWSSVTAFSNFYSCFFKQHGYFSEGPMSDPLLHMWTLSLEWQFYLVWPFVCLFIVRTPFWTPSLLAAAATSVVMGEVMARSGEPWVTVAYYMLPFRCYGLLLGSWVALARPEVDWTASHLLNVAKKAISPIGLAAIVLPMVLLTPAMPFPGLASLPACVGTALLLFDGREQSSWVHRLLGWKVLSGLGVISYSVYLFHFPLISLLRLGGFDYGSHIIVLCIFSVFLGLVSYLMVEQPALKITWSPLKVIVFLWLVPCLLLAGFVSVPALHGVLRSNPAVVKGGGAKSFSPLAQNVSSQQPVIASYPDARKNFCEIDGVPSVQSLMAKPTLNWPRDECIAGAAAAAASSCNVMYVGDSFGPGYTGIIDGFASAMNVSYWTLSKQATVPGWRGPANTFIASKILLHEAAMGNLKGAILGAHWSRALFDADGSIEQVYNLVDRLLQLNVSVLIMGSTPTFEGRKVRCPSPACPVMLAAARDSDFCSSGHLRRLDTYDPVNNLLRSFADSRSRVHFWNPCDFMCPEGVCRPYDHTGECYFADGVHIHYGEGLRLSRSIAHSQGVPSEFRLIFGRPAYSESAALISFNKVAKFYTSGGKELVE